MLATAALLLLLSADQVVGHAWQSDPDAQDASLACKSAGVDHSKTVVAAVGDSITVGATCRTWKGGFVKVMQDVLGEEKYDVRDCGLCGHDAVRANHGNKKHATYWNTSAMAESKAMKPDYVIFMLGTNDADEWYNTSKYFSQDFLDLVTYYRDMSNKPKVITMIPPPLSNFTCSDMPGGSNPTCLAPYNKACVIDCVLPKLVPSLTKQLGLPPPLDLLTFLGGPTHTNKSAMPGLHPDCDGYELLGHYIAHEVFKV